MITARGGVGSVVGAAYGTQAAAANPRDANVEAEGDGGQYVVHDVEREAVARQVIVGDVAHQGDPHEGRPGGDNQQKGSGAARQGHSWQRVTRTSR